jgi:hypothetical protein
MSDVNTAAVIGKHVASALERHRDAAGFIRLVATELPPRERPPWVRMADALDRGDVAAGTAAATRSIGCWIPLFASQARDPRLAVRLLQTAARPAVAPAGPWLLLVYLAAVTALAFGLLLGFSVIVVPAFSWMHSWWSPSRMPLLTRAAFALPGFMASIWQPLLAVVGIVGLFFSLWLTGQWSARSDASSNAFTRTLARLIAAEVPVDEALALASHAVAARAVDPAEPRRPLGYAAAAATDFAPRTAAVLLDAIADAHDDRSRSRRNSWEWLVGPVLIALVGLIVALLTFGLFQPPNSIMDLS